MRLESIFGLVLAVLILLCLLMLAVGFRTGIRAKEWTKAGGTIAFVAFLLFVILVGGTYPLAHKLGSAISNRAGLVVIALDAALIGGFGAGLKQKRGSLSGVGLYMGITALVAGSALVQFSNQNNQVLQVTQQLGVDTLGPHKVGSDPVNCPANLKNLYQAFSVYTQDWGALPPAANWTTNEELSTIKAHPQWLHCPELATGSYGYAYNEAVAGHNLKGQPLNQIPNAAKIPLLYDSTVTGPDAHDAFTSLPKPGRHQGKDNVLYCDGHVEPVAP